MKTTKVYLAQRLSCMPDSSLNSHPVIEIITILPKGQDNSFYIEPFDHDKKEVKLSWDHPACQAIYPDEMNEGDDISFDVKDGLFNKCVLWKGRKFRQLHYPFDTYANEQASGFTGYDFLKDK